MALEALTLTPPSGSSIALNDGSKWGMESLDIGQPGKREDLIASLDADGALPARISPRDTREVTATIRLLDAANMNAALNSIAAVEAILESAERLAANNPTNPVTDCVRLVYTPAGSTYSYSFIVLSAEITGLPRSISGEDAGWFIARPVVTIRAVCDPFAYGTTGTTPFMTTFLDHTAAAGSYAVSAGITGVTGDVPPWARLRIKDVDSRVRSRVLAGVKVNEGQTTPVIGTASLTAIAGTIASGTVTTYGSALDWVATASLPRQTRTGTYRVYLADARSPGTGSVRLTWNEVGGSRRSGPEVSLTTAGRVDAYLGEVVASSSWDAWIESKGSSTYAAVVLIPTDSFVEITGAAGSEQIAGAATVVDGLATDSATLNGRALTTGSGTWSSASTWQVDDYWLTPPVGSGARRTTVSMASPLLAIAGSTNVFEVSLTWNSRTLRDFTTAALDTSGLRTGAVARYVDANNYVWAGWVNDGVSDHANARPYIVKVVGGTSTTIWSGDVVSQALFGTEYAWKLQITGDGRWYIEIATVTTGTGVVVTSASGQDAALVQGETLGNPTSSKVGLIDFYSRATPAMTRDLVAFSAAPLVGVTPPPLPSGGTLTLAGPKLLNNDGAEYPYVGSSGIRLQPGVSNNLTVLTRRFAGLMLSGATTTDALDLDVDGYPRFISVPHT